MDHAHGGLDRQLKVLALELANPRAPSSLPALDPEVLERSLRLVWPICDVYFRSDVRHLDRVPPGPTLVVGNHDGGLLPFHAVCFAAEWHRYFRIRRPLRILTHEIPFHITPSLTRWLHAVGAVSAAPPSLEAALDRAQSVLVYPGGAREVFRTFARRREIDLGGRAGFVARALRRGVPITPVASAGGHETAFILARGSGFARRVGIYKYLRADAWPIVVGLPWGIWVGPMIPYIPLPTKITHEVLAPVDLRDELSSLLHREIRADDADDPVVVRAGFELVLNPLQRAVKRLYGERHLPVIG